MKLRALLVGCVGLLSLSLVSAQPPVPTPADKAIDDAARLLEKALADTKEPAERVKLQNAIAALRRANTAKVAPQNELITDLIDNRKKYVGQKLTLRLTYNSNGSTLRDEVGRTPAVFTAIDPKTKAKLVIGIKLPNGLEVPAAKDGEEVVVTFIVDSEKSNTAVSITRP